MTSQKVIMADIEHPTAVYLDKATNERCVISAESLRDPKVLAHVRALALLDASEQVSVAPRFSSKGTPHFYATSTGTRRVYGGERDAAHDKRTRELVDSLQPLEKWSIALKIRKQLSTEPREVAYEQELHLPKYQWGFEIHRILSETTIVRHDIFGQANELSMSRTRPWVAIEVINTHFPEEAAYSAFIETSRAVPLIVLFDFVEFQNRFVSVEQANARLVYRPWTYLIKEGCLWKGANRLGLKNADEFEADAEKMLRRWRKQSQSSVG